MNSKFDYDDIINLPHHVSQTRPRMSRADRAAQFSPFAALTGHSDAIKETARLTFSQYSYDEDFIKSINRKLCILKDFADTKPIICIIYFVKDEKKEGGHYENVSGSLKKINIFNKTLVLSGGETISFDSIADIESDIFKNLI